MNMPGFIIYLVGDKKKYRVGVSQFPELDAKYYLEQGMLEDSWDLFLLTEKLSLLKADYIYRKFSTEEERQWKHFDSDFFGLRIFNFFIKMDSLGGVLDHKKKQLRKLLTQLELEDKLALQKIAAEEVTKVNLAAREELNQVYHLIQGRKLYKTEIIKLVRENDSVIDNLDQTLLQLRLTNKLALVPSVKYRGQELICQRCGSTNIIEVECNYCYAQDYYCQDCTLLGEARGCRGLYLIPGDNQIEFKSIQLQLNFQLTKLQSKISEQLVDFLWKPGEEMMLWAVCGAGKTEVSFNVIVECLAQGGQVLFAIPRKDVVIELAQRLKEAFPDIKIKALYGGTTERYQQADLVIATTHQLLRYHRAFDLVILDEMDAFPYQGSAMLQRALYQAKKKLGKLIYMTATPKQAQLDSQMPIVKLPSRYHGHPLPEPELITADLEYNQDSGEIYITEEVIARLKLSVEQDLAQVFLFVPTKKLVRSVTQFLEPRFPVVNGQSWVQGSHSQDKNRDEKRESFAAGEYPILVSTTIMERGITVEKANVMVLFADYDFVFNEQTLVQMAGRSGRSAKYPQGRVWFIGEEISEAMEIAKRQIMTLNEEARKKGYLRTVNNKE
ncbi:DEAD/DEAH box helicase [Halanaerobacter jeridensis]|uniref:Competence protein ComFA n=1 Tax=Halanaerobacter jeridensis TaxID=706427 RepID=A0A939BMT9_9FIRM|nr:DEAD/DEAH box helicase [Halanaerobacter jeridensis]MBM7557480.1 competence protein ComFA [Halanaerobacter jeridensis]